MNQEPRSNIGYRCNKHKLKPDPKFLEYAPVWFIDKFCKLAFPCPDGRNEYMWVKTTDFSQTGEEELLGILNNDPIFAEFKCGDLIEFSRSEILQVLSEEDGN